MLLEALGQPKAALDILQQQVLPTFEQMSLSLERDITLNVIDRLRALA